VQLVSWKAGNILQYEPFVHDVTGLIVGVQYSGQITLSAILAIVMARVKPIAINYVMFGNPFAMNAVKSTQIHSWLYEAIARIDPAQRNSYPPHAYISVINK